jgi:glucosamine-phosphate N-acetyltransferase
MFNIVMILRKLEIDDYNKKYIELLEQLTEVGHVSHQEFIFFISILNDNHQIWVFEDQDKIVAAGTLLKEQKLIHGFNKVAHIEDVVVDSNYRGQKLAQKIIDKLVLCSDDCYKVILDCGDDLEHFYNKCKFKRNGIQMARYL